VFGQAGNRHLRIFNNVDGDDASFGLGVLDPSNSAYDCYVNMKQDPSSTSNNICYRFGSKTANPKMIYSYNMGRLLISTGGVSDGTIPNECLDVRGNTIVQSNAPKIIMKETDASADNGRWDILAEAENLNIRAVNDADSAATNAIQITRTGTTIDNININASTTVVNDLTINGSLSGYTPSPQLDYSRTNKRMIIYRADSGVIQYGSASVSISSGNGSTVVTLNVAMQDTTYAVNITRTDGVNYQNMQYTVYGKTTTSFGIACDDFSGSTSATLTFDYIVMGPQNVI